MSINYIKIDNINKKIKKKEIIKNNSLLLAKGNITGVIGPNGSGKSSLFKILSGLWTYDTGTIKFDDINFIDCKSKILPKIGSFIESPTFYDDLTAKQNFDLFVKLYNIKDTSSFNKIIKTFEIDKFSNIKLKKCSLGMKQKVGLAISLIKDPDIIILDEPTNSLDVNSVKSLHELLLYLKKDKIIIISSHILEELDSLCDEIYILNNGEIIEKHSIKNTNFYIIEFDSKITELNNCNIIKYINDKTLKIECKDLNSLFNECTNKKIKILNIKNESNTKNLFNRIIGD